MVAPLDRMPPTGSFLQSAGVNPGERSRHHAKVEVVLNYIEVYYNRRRRHSTIGYKSPAMFELDCMKQEHVA